ncbi:unnamed protein product [Cladocopium goreaui]|uniref:Uncharacterized protein n=1 Tax=Cladocopium goreaui TaxID=2562237 RepID=A0A9P1CYY2_9DINO|nr:unnamed protein product [Cladocopium goreaui]
MRRISQGQRVYMQQLSKYLTGEALGEALKVNGSVTEIYLGCNHVGDEGVKALAEALKINASVTDIDLRCNQIGAEGAKALGEALKTNASVTNINLRDNKIGDEGAKALAEALKTNGSVTNITLDKNQIGDEGAKAWCVVGSAECRGPYLIHDEASTPSDVLLQAKAEARRMRSTISLSKASLPGKALSRGGPSLGSTHFSSRMHNSSTSIGELQESVDTVQTLVSPFSSVDDDSELLLEHSEMILQHWKKEGQPKLWLVDKILGSPKSDASLTFDAGVDHTLTSASMVLFKVENDAYGTGAPKHEEEEEKFTVGDAVQLIAGGTVIGAVAEDMLRKLKNTGPRSGLSRSYIETCERFGKLADKVKEVFEQMEEIAKFEVGCDGCDVHQADDAG